MSDVDLRSVGRALLDTNRYLTLATADGDGRPWANPVWYSHRDYREFVWVSRPDTRHSVNVQRRPEVTFVVFDSSLPPAQRQAVYVAAVAAAVPEPDVAAALEIFNARSAATGEDQWTLDRVTGAAELRLYVAVAQQQWLLREDRDERVAVSLIAEPE
ncbi:MAG TPA: pyridoxamine 5'-phosphate oxidase family protein [Jatrophihabitans sp.]|nr:pyridoxamine 5'-phosphate oxidase family protein [Jatrophihabitans sp.]